MRSARAPLLRATLTAGVFVLTGCANTPMLAKASSPYVGCDPDAISITDAYGTGMFASGTPTWIATCADRRWFCSIMNDMTVCSDLPEGFELSE